MICFLLTLKILNHAFEHTVRSMLGMKDEFCYYIYIMKNR